MSGNPEVFEQDHVGATRSSHLQAQISRLSLGNMVALAFQQQS